MPVTEVNSANITFAFSEKQDAWTTRYSFVPTCYANCDDQMLSFKEALGKVWLHDKSSTRNRFYDGLNPSFLEVSFNDSPSEVKVFNSVSLETNTELAWTTGFSCNTEHQDENNQNTLTETLLGGRISDKEGFKYFELPKSVSNSTANVVPAPALLSSVEGSTGQEQTETAVAEAQQLYVDNLDQNIYQPIPVTVPLDQVSSSSFLSTPYGDNVELLGYFQGNQSFPIPTGMYSFSEMFSQLIGSYYVFSSGQIPLGASISISNIQNGFITFFVNFPPLLQDFPEGDIDLFFFAIQDFLVNSSAIFAMTPPEVNGDQMRGPYLNARLRCNTPDPLELHSVNVDYAFSSSAARLTQNS
tara:strand:+ start:3532 stop:4602 length:1071 start_codon:yes stop_codon:yes gene_type:complete